MPPRSLLKHRLNKNHLPTKSLLHKFCFLLIVMLMGFYAIPQIDPAKLDSLSRAIDSSSKAYKAWQDSFTKVQDSLYRSSLKKDIEQNNRNLQQYLAEQKRRERKERQQAYIRIFAGLSLFIVLIFVLLRKRRLKF